MNLLVVGNGFDLAHGLPTRYSDFLDFLTLCVLEWHDWRKFHVWPGESNPWKNDACILDDLVQTIKSNQKVSEKVVEIFETNKSDIEKAFGKEGTLSIFNDNTWVRYCLYVYAYKKSFAKEFNWIDIEDEMLRFIRYIESQKYTGTSVTYLSMNLPYYKFPDNYTTIQFDVRSVIRAMSSSNIPEDMLKRKIFEHLFRELEQFSESLKFYLSLVMEQFRENPTSIFAINTNAKESIYVDHIVSFNYTYTAQMCYGNNNNVHYVNGQLEDEKIILGVENPSLDKTHDYCDNYVNLFFKNIQRILYNYGYTYSTWLYEYTDTIGNRVLFDGETVSGVNVHIIGHSLAISDKYILTDIIMSADRVSIYYYNEQDKKDKITNLYRLLGDKDFSNHVNHSKVKPTISFIDQAELMVSNHEPMRTAEQ